MRDGDRLYFCFDFKGKSFIFESCFVIFYFLFLFTNGVGQPPPGWSSPGLSSLAPAQRFRFGARSMTEWPPLLGPGTHAGSRGWFRLPTAGKDFSLKRCHQFLSRSVPTLRCSAPGFVHFAEDFSAPWILQPGSKWSLRSDSSQSAGFGFSTARE
jgi:hypothetical protein